MNRPTFLPGYLNRELVAEIDMAIKQHNFGIAENIPTLEIFVVDERTLAVHLGSFGLHRKREQGPASGVFYEVLNNSSGHFHVKVGNVV